MNYTYDLAAQDVGHFLEATEEDAYSDQSILLGITGMDLEVLLSNEQFRKLAVGMIEHAVDNNLLSAHDLNSLSIRLGFESQDKDREIIEASLAMSDKELARL